VHVQQCAHFAADRFAIVEIDRAIPRVDVKAQQGAGVAGAEFAAQQLQSQRLHGRASKASISCCFTLRHRRASPWFGPNKKGREAPFGYFLFPDDSARKSALAESSNKKASTEALSFPKLVAGAGFEPATFGL
jgi:hypothetical protein